MCFPTPERKEKPQNLEGKLVTSRYKHTFVRRDGYSTTLEKMERSHLSLAKRNYSISISACGVWGVKVSIQVFRKELHTHIHLD